VDVCAPDGVRLYRNDGSGQKVPSISLPAERSDREMGQHKASVIWERVEAAAFVDNRYSRAHRWEFDGGTVVPASSSPSVVPVPLSDPAGVDPEEAFVASLSSCHMLWFLFFAAKGGFVVDSYRDGAVGHMEKTADGNQWMARVVLRPEIRFSGQAPDAAATSAMHDKAHHACFIANSVKTTVTVEGVE
jgi:organic hydroperoxide reductase OsmC/OhrA